MAKGKTKKLFEKTEKPNDGVTDSPDLSKRFGRAESGSTGTGTGDDVPSLGGLKALVGTKRGKKAANPWKYMGMAKLSSPDICGFLDAVGVRCILYETTPEPENGKRADSMLVVAMVRNLIPMQYGHEDQPEFNSKHAVYIPLKT